MRKRIINQNLHSVDGDDQNWFDLQQLAQIELTSEEADHPIEAALIIPGDGLGWRAAQPGEQTLRLLFDELQTIKRIQLLFQEDKQARTQEFVLLWSSDARRSWREIVRQQYHFSPPDTEREFENYTIDLVGVSALELRIVPDIRGGDARASIAQLRIG
jgi:hypothetical protein